MVSFSRASSICRLLQTHVCVMKGTCEFSRLFISETGVASLVQYTPPQQPFIILFLHLYWFCYNIAFVLPFGPLARRHVGSYLPDQGSNLQPLHWKAKSQPFGPLGKSPFIIFWGHGAGGPWLLGDYGACASVAFASEWFVTPQVQLPVIQLTFQNVANHGFNFFEPLGMFKQ